MPHVWTHVLNIRNATFEIHLFLASSSLTFPALSVLRGRIELCSELSKLKTITSHRSLVLFSQLCSSTFHFYFHFGWVQFSSVQLAIHEKEARHVPHPPPPPPPPPLRLLAGFSCQLVSLACSGSIVCLTETETGLKWASDRRRMSSSCRTIFL